MLPCSRNDFLPPRDVTAGFLVILGIAVFASPSRYDPIVWIGIVCVVVPGDKPVSRGSQPAASDSFGDGDSRHSCEMPESTARMARFAHPGIHTLLIIE
jgi:hypothetical protein